jgi:hypothetical protein
VSQFFLARSIEIKIKERPWSFIDRILQVIKETKAFFVAAYKRVAG